MPNHPPTRLSFPTAIGLVLIAIVSTAALLSASCGTDNSAEIKALREDVARLSQLQTGPDKVAATEFFCRYLETDPSFRETVLHFVDRCVINAQVLNPPRGLAERVRLGRELTIRTPNGNTYKVITDADKDGNGIPPLKIGDEWPPK